jgi:hypothetical protein
MSTVAVESVIRKAVVDLEFRSLLLSNPGGALSEYDLSDEERASLSNLDTTLFNGSAEDLEQRLSRVYRGGWDGN